eukprot:GFYU01004233.1.p1 GENE.GFYU01004233.1~~GFYU01004233.1.p1  ORF type:complete len:105 (-),score=10.57 GFYU01004233.1:31-345(-)
MRRWWVRDLTQNAYTEALVVVFLVESLDEEQLAETLTCELINLLAVLVDLVRDQQTLQSAWLWNWLEHAPTLVIVLRIIGEPTSLTHLGPLLGVQLLLLELSLN